ncbi:MAG: DUF2461 domain-containing protein [Bacteroidota bacterium]
MVKKMPLDELEFYPPFEGFPRKGMEFLRRLKRNNRREWFAKHKDEYEALVKLPMQSLIVALQPYFAEFAPEYELHPKRSIFRIYRDTRFSKDKTPYKTHVAAHAVLRGKPKGLGASGYYFHIEPGEVYVGAGIYMPESDLLKKIRLTIVERPQEFLSIVKSGRFKKTFAELEMKEDRLQRVPAGFDKNDPMAEWLRYKHYFAGVSLPVSKCHKRGFANDVARVCEEATPLVKFLNRALGITG